jgi:hypothetical protein
MAVLPAKYLFFSGVRTSSRWNRSRYHTFEYAAIVVSICGGRHLHDHSGTVRVRDDEGVREITVAFGHPIEPTLFAPL